MSILFDQIIFGPVRSRRFGISLGINLLPTSYKYCTFDCVYCECGWTQHREDRKQKLFTPAEVISAFEEKSRKLVGSGIMPDNLTFAGNGEPTLHPHFHTIVDETIRIRDHYFPKARITVLSNATQLHKSRVRDALLNVDNNVLKLDCGTEEMFRRINRPLGSITLAKIVDLLRNLNGHLTIQTLFVRGTYQGGELDNTTEAELNAWMGHLQQIRPGSVMIYSIDRNPPVSSIQKVPAEELYRIASRVEKLGLKTEVYP
ncbi:MAG: radical SAM protein [Bacteroidales bacterium]|nr:radical SAM protein [Bacteroidales bacterium]